MASIEINVSIIKADSRYEQLLPPMADEDYERLKSSIKTEGVRDPVILWEGQNVLIDGYNRIRACRELGIDNVSAIFLRFPGTHDVERWIITNQLSRRNLTDEQRVRYIGILVKGLKKTHGGVRENAGRGGSSSKESSRQNDDLILGRAVEQVADDMGISPKTVERADKFDTAVTRIGKVSQNAAAKIMTGKARQIVRKGTIEKLATASDEDIKKAAEAIDQGKPIEKKPQTLKPKDVAESDLLDALANLETQVDGFAKLIRKLEKTTPKERILFVHEHLSGLAVKIEKLMAKYLKT